MDDGIVGKIIAQSPRVLPLGASLALFNVYQDMRPDLPLYEFMSVCVGALGVISGALFIIKWLFDWPPTPGLGAESN
jgi:hypothetical protein